MRIFLIKFTPKALIIMPDSSSNKVFPLALAQPGKNLRISAMLCGRGHNRRLADLGIPLGSEIRVIQSIGPGRLIIGNGNGRLALGPSCAHNIMVSAVS